MFNIKKDIPFIRLAWRNTRRNTRRTLLTVTAVTVAVATLTFGYSYVSGVYDNMLDTYARTETGHVRIRNEDYTPRERFLPIHENVSHVSELLPVIRAQADVKEVLPRIRSSVLVDGTDSNRPGLLIGVDLEREEGYFNPSEMTAEGRLPRPGYAEILVGKEFATKLNVSIGDDITLLGQTAYRSLGGLRMTITGLAVTGMSYMDNMLLLAPIDQVQDMTYLQDATTEILVFAQDPEQADTLAATLRQVLTPIADDNLEISSWTQHGSLLRLLETSKPIFGFAIFIMLLMAGLIIINTMLMTVMERTNEFGMLATLGMRRSDIVVLIVMEGLVIGLIGAVFGGLLGTGISVWLEQTGIDMTAAAKGIDLPFEGMLYPNWQLSYVLFNALLGLLTAGLAALYPALRAIRKTPAEALRA